VEGEDGEKEDEKIVENKEEEKPVEEVKEEEVLPF
jgi:hypothetical protein